MIKYVKHEGIVRPVIMMDEILVSGDIREMRQALVDVFTACVRNDAAMETLKASSLWYLVRLIDETAIEEKGGVCNE